MPSVEFVYFDLDDTLLDHRHAERCALADVCQIFREYVGHIPVETVQSVYHEHNVELWRRYAAGEIDRDELRRLRFELVLEALAVEGLDVADVDRHYIDCYARHWKVTDGALEAFHAVADRYPVGVLTNGFGHLQHAKLARFPELRERLSTLVISEEVGHLKPHPALFAHAADVAGIAPESILYVGDSYTSDVQGAVNAGWQMAWYTDQKAIEDAREPFFRFSEWNALVDWLEH